MDRSGSPIESQSELDANRRIARTGQKVYIRRHVATDKPRFLVWYQDDEIAELLRHDLSPLSPHQARAYFDSIILPASARNLCWAVCEVGSDRLVGSTAIVDKDERKSSALFRIVIGEKDCWGMGYGTEATNLVLAEAFTTHRLGRVNLEVFSHNPRAQGAYKRAGFERTGQHAEWVSGAHRQIDVIEMSISRERWLQTAS